jgi:hypothetical protein
MAASADILAPRTQAISEEMIEATRPRFPKGRLAKIDDIVSAYVFPTGAGTAGFRSGSIAHLVASEAAKQGLRVRFAPSDPKAPEKCAAGR